MSNIKVKVIFPALQREEATQISRRRNAKRRARAETPGASEHSTCGEVYHALCPPRSFIWILHSQSSPLPT